MIPKGCCCKNSFSFPFKPGNVSRLYITYQQNGKNVVEKTIDDCIFENDKVLVDITQQESLLFDENFLELL